MQTPTVFPGNRYQEGAAAEKRKRLDHRSGACVTWHLGTSSERGYNSILANRTPLDAIISGHGLFSSLAPLILFSLASLTITSVRAPRPGIFSLYVCRNQGQMCLQHQLALVFRSKRTSIAIILLSLFLGLLQIPSMRLSMFGNTFILFIVPPSFFLFYAILLSSIYYTSFVLAFWIVAGSNWE